jgi:hypothetical protein
MLDDPHRETASFVDGSLRSAPNVDGRGTRKPSRDSQALSVRPIDNAGLPGPMRKALVSNICACLAVKTLQRPFKFERPF